MNKLNTLVEEEEEEGPFVVAAQKNDLETFREEWTRELKGAEPEPSQAERDQQEKDLHEKAREFFQEGVRQEENGNLYDAIRFYKKAVQLVPDIEQETFVYNTRKQANNKQNIVDTEGIEGEGDMLDHEGNEEDEMQNLLEKFSQIKLQRKPLIQPEFSTKSVHIGELPAEVLNYILKWIVSPDLDLSSLESVSEVCRGFYVVARDQEIWRQICVRVWGPAVLSAADLPWREYFLHKPRVLFAGCYIGKTTYIREGERGFQDHESYKAWHLVQYFRFIRLFPGGRMLMTLSAEDPGLTAKLMNNRNSCSIQTAMYGDYRVVDNTLVCFLQQQNKPKKIQQKFSKRKRRDSMVYHDVPDQDFLLEFYIKGSKNRILQWKSYVIVSKYQNGRETRDPVTLSDNAFPRLIYSGVGSYHFESSSPL